MKKYTVKQDNIKDCGVACLSSIIKYYKGYASIERLREMTKTDKSGTTAYHIKKTLIDLGFNCRVVKCEKQEIANELITKPCIAHVVMEKKYSHYVVIYKIDKIKRQLLIMDPSFGYKKYSFDEFNKIWTGVIIIFYPVKKIPVLDKKISIFEFGKKIVYPHKKTIFGIIILSILITIFSIANSFYFKYIIDSVSSTQSSDFYLTSLIFLSIIILKLLTDFSRNSLLIHINKKIDITLFLDSINHIISLPYQYYKNRTTGEIISRINDLSYIREMISRVAIILFVDIILASFALIFLYLLNPALFLISIIILFMYILIVIIFNPKLQKYINYNIEEQAEVTSCMIESINAFETIKGIHLEEEIKEKIKDKYTKFIDNVFKFNKLSNFQNTIKDMISYIGTFAILFFGTIMVINNQLSLGTLITYNVLFLYFIEPIRNVIDLELLIRQSYSSVRRIIELREINPELFDNKETSLIKGDISFNNLNFTYNDKDNILKDVKLQIKEKEKILIIGDSGSGKSTLVKLLLGYYKPNKNQLVIGEKDINDYDLDTIRQSVSYVAQNETLLTDTIYNNIDMNRKIKEDKLNEIAKLLLLDEIIINNPLGYNLLLEENGFNISGGERQRIILARALIKDSSILILDESTSQIDLLKERIIFSNILKKYKEKTIIVISHRTENSDLFERIVKLEKKESD